MGTGDKRGFVGNGIGVFVLELGNASMRSGFEGFETGEVSGK